jgi:hypothetical protein
VEAAAQRLQQMKFRLKRNFKVKRKQLYLGQMQTMRSDFNGWKLR